MAPTSWQDHWKHQEDANGDKYGEDMEKADNQNSLCR
jgi:hypothetical protein